MAPLVFITGASSGIGQALAWAYYQQGWRLALVARRTEALQEWARQQGLAAERYRTYSADVTQADSIIAAGSECMQSQGVPDVVIASAGISIGINTAVREDLDVMARILATNTLGMAATFHPFLAAMRERGRGVLVGIASVAGLRGLPGHGGYCASKAAAIAYCESLRVELHGSGVQVVTLCPGYIDTPLTRGNPYSMPFLMDAGRFASQALPAIAAGRSMVILPWQMRVVSWLLRVLPNAAFDRLGAKRGRKPRAGPRSAAD